tara:strand:- start:283 stop:504 length:222 start_codon:yes stop_codon:yes gene_type:complete
MFKILLAKFTASKDEADLTKALEYLETNKASFGIELDYLKVVLQARLHRQHILQSADNTQVIKDLLCIIKTNF